MKALINCMRTNDNNGMKSSRARGRRNTQQHQRFNEDIAIHFQTPREFFQEKETLKKVTSPSQSSLQDKNAQQALRAPQSAIPEKRQTYPHLQPPPQPPVAALLILSNQSGNGPQTDEATTTSLSSTLKMPSRDHLVEVKKKFKIRTKVPTQLHLYLPSSPGGCGGAENSPFQTFEQIADD